MSKFVVARLRLAACVSVLAVASPSIAQTVPPAVPNTLPTPEELRRQPDTTVQPPRVERLRRGATAQGPCPESLASSGLTVALSSVEFVGSAGPLPAVVARELAGVGSSFVGRPQPLRALCEIRDAAAAVLTRAGYVSAVLLPEQEITDGRVTLRVVLAKIVDVEVQGRPTAVTTAVVNRLKALEPFNEREAERMLLVASDTPGSRVTLTLKPSPSGREGEVVGVLSAEQQAGALFVNLQNYGSREIGRESALVRGELYDVTGLGDRTFVSLFSTLDFDEQRLIQAGHDFAAGGSGLRLGGSYTYAWTEPTIEQAGVRLDVKSRSSLGTLFATLPLARSLDRSAALAAGLDIVDQKTRIAGLAVTKDRLRVASLRLDGDVAERPLFGSVPRWRLAGGVELRKGIDAFGALERGEASGTALPSRLEGDPTAFLVRGNAGALARMPVADTLFVTASADGRFQYTDDPLLSFEEFAVGNFTIGRGYDPGAAAGDRAIGVQAELRLGEAGPTSRTDVAWELVGFYDTVRVKDLDSFAGPARTLDSVGGGVRLAFGDRARLDLTYAHPLDRAQPTDARRADDRLLLSLTVRAWPWAQ